jgi:hypothetical protein
MCLSPFMTDNKLYANIRIYGVNVPFVVVINLTLTY